MPAVTVSPGSWTARTFGGLGVLGAACVLLSATPAWAGVGSASAPVTLTVRLPARGWVGAWTTMRVSYDNRSKRRAVLSVYTGLRDTGLVRASRVRVQRRWSDGRWVDERLAPGDEEYFVIDRADVVPPGHSTVLYRLRSTSGPGTLRVRVIAVAGSDDTRLGFHHPIAGGTAVLTVARPALTPTSGRSGQVVRAVVPTSPVRTATPAITVPTISGSVSPAPVSSAEVTSAPVSLAARRERAEGGGTALLVGVTIAASAVCAALIVALLRRGRGSV